MTWVKICGITNLDDALVAVKAGADAVGFVFYEKSPRCVSVETAREIVAKLPENVEKVGVFVGSSGPDWVRVVLSAGLTAVQRYVDPRGEAGQEKATGRIFTQPPKIFMAFPVEGFLEMGVSLDDMASSFEHLRSEAPGQPPIPEGVFDTFVLDSGGSLNPGGTGKAFDWTKAVRLSEGMRRGGLKLIVAGGLTSRNVGEAIGILHPWGVDVSSGVEVSPGKKDREKVRTFVRAVREMDRKVGG